MKSKVDSLFYNSLNNKTLKASEIKKLPRTVYYQTSLNNWMGRSTGIIHDGLYLEVYPAHSFDRCSNKYTSFKKCEPSRIPLSRVYSF